MDKNKEKNGKKANNKIKIFLFIILLIILATGVATGVFTYLQKIDKRDNANSLVYLGIMEDGTYYVQDAPKDIRFQVDSEDASLYNITNQNGEKISSKIVKNGDKKFIQAENKYTEGDTYIIELEDGINFTDEAIKSARKIKFNITESEKAEYEISDKVKTDTGSYNLQIQENDGVKTVSIQNTNYKQNDILIIDNYPYKIENIENEVATLSRPDLSEIYENLDFHKKDEINFDNIVINDEFKEQIELGVKESDFYTFLESKVYAAEDITPKVKLTSSGNSLKIEIEIDVKPKGEAFLGIQSLEEHGVKFKFSIDLSSEYIADVKLGKNIDLGVVTSQKINFSIEIYSDNKFFKGVSGLSDEQYAKTVQDIIDQLEKAEKDKTEGKASLINGIELPTGIWGLNVYFDIYFQTSVAMQLNAKYTQTLEFKQVCGLTGDTNEIKPYSNNSVVNSSIEAEFQGKAEAKVGLGIDIGLSFISKDFAQVSLGMEVGIYDGVYALVNVGVKSEENNSINVMENYRAEAGIYVEIKYSASIDFHVAKIATNGSIAETRKPLLIAGTDEITKSIESSPSEIYVSNNQADVPKIYKNILNLNTNKTRKEECTSDVEFSNADGNIIEVTNGKLNLGSNDEKNIYITYREFWGIYTMSIPVSATPTEQNNTTVSDISHDNNDSNQQTSAENETSTSNNNSDNNQANTKTETSSSNNNQQNNTEVETTQEKTFNVGNYILHYGTYKGTCSKLIDTRIFTATITMNLKEDGTYTYVSTNQEVSKNRSGTYRIENNTFILDSDEPLEYIVLNDDLFIEGQGSGYSFLYQGN